MSLLAEADADGGGEKFSVGGARWEVEERGGLVG